MTFNTFLNKLSIKQKKSAMKSKDASNIALLGMQSGNWAVIENVSNKPVER